MALIHYLVYTLMLATLTNGGDVDADIQGNIYVVDPVARTLTRYSSTGQKMYTTDARNETSRSLYEPSSVVARSGTDVWVCDTRNNRVIRFNRTLDWISTLYTADDPDERRRFGLPRDIAVTRQGDLIVIDGENVRALRFGPLGQLVTILGDASSGAGRLADPRHVEVDGVDNIYVLDQGEILRYDPFGTFSGRLPLPINGTIVTFSIAGDTLVVCDSTVAFTYSLSPLQNIDAIELPRPVTSIRRYRDGYIVAEEGQAGVVAVRSRE